MVLCISTKLHENISKGFIVLSGHDIQTKIFQGAQFSKNVGGVMVFVLCTSSHNALYLYQIL